MHISVQTCKVLLAVKHQHTRNKQVLTSNSNNGAQSVITNRISHSSLFTQQHCHQSFWRSKLCLEFFKSAQMYGLKAEKLKKLNFDKCLFKCEPSIEDRVLLTWHKRALICLGSNSAKFHLREGGRRKIEGYLDQSLWRWLKRRMLHPKTLK